MDKLRIVADKQPVIERAECRIHGPVGYAIEAVACPIMGKNGKAIRQNHSKRLLCPLCLIEGEFTEVGR